MVNSQTTFTFYIFIFGFLGPLAFILIFYVLVIIKLRSVGPRGQERSQSKRKSHRKVSGAKLTMMLVVGAAPRTLGIRPPPLGCNRNYCNEINLAADHLSISSTCFTNVTKRKRTHCLCQ